MGELIFKSESMFESSRCPIIFLCLLPAVFLMTALVSGNLRLPLVLLVNLDILGSQYLVELLLTTAFIAFPTLSNSRNREVFTSFTVNIRNMGDLSFRVTIGD